VGSRSCGIRIRQKKAVDLDCREYSNVSGCLMHIAVLILPAGAGMAAQFASVEKREWLVSMLAARDWRWALMITVSLLTLTSGAAAENVQFAVETLNATIESRDGGRLRVVFGKGEQPALLFKPVQGAWNWSATSKLSLSRTPATNPWI